MVSLISCAILSACIVLFYLLVKRADGKRLFLQALTVPFVFYMVNYPVRALILQLGIWEPEFSFDAYDILIPLEYSFVFFLIMYVTYRQSSIFRDENDVKSITRTEADEFLCNVTFVISLLVFGYKVYTGNLFELYSEESELYSSFGNNLIMMFGPLKWFAIALALLLWKCTANRWRLMQALVMFCMILVESIVSSAKGPLFSLLILYLFTMSAYGKRINYYLVTLSASAIIILSIFSYYIRYFGQVTGEFSAETLTRNYQVASEISQSDYDVKTGLGHIANRLNYLDALALTVKKRDTVTTGNYPAGSFSELLTLVPRFVWENRPLFNFNIFATREIWGYSELISETPIGRIGESFLVLGFFGLLYAVFYGFIFAFIEKLVIGMRTVHLAYYFFLLNYYVIPDSHIVFYWKTILFESLVLYLMILIYRQTAYSGEARC